MSRVFGVACLALSLFGCDRISSNTWKSKYLKEIEYHYQTQQIKNAEIAARDLEVENQRQFMAVMSERIEHLEKDNRALRDQLLHEQKSERRVPVAECVGKVTAVAGEIGMAVLNVGDEQGLIVGDEFEITRNGQKIVRIKLERVDRKWCAGKVIGTEGTPAVGDTATLVLKKP